MKLLSGAIPFRRSKEQPPAPGPGPVPPPAPEPAPPAPDPQPPMPDPTPPAPELRAVSSSEPSFTPILINGAPREWNVWELERIASDSEALDEEVAFLLLELRQFANAHGQLPVSFDPVVRESFGELLYAAV